MYILGIHDGHNCGASLVQNGKVVFSICEERITRKKNEVGYPEMSINEVLRLASIAPSELSAIVYASNFMHSKEHLEDVKPWYRVGLKDQNINSKQSDEYKKNNLKVRTSERIKCVVSHLEVSIDKISFVEHHLAHLSAAYYTRALTKENNKEILGITCDGAGDGLSSTVSICNGNAFDRISSSSRHESLGKLFSRTTMLMGMKPWEHEYKLMGLAPYADPDRTEKAVKIFENILDFDEDNLKFKLVSDLSTNYIYEYLRDSFQEVRFDVIASSIQKFTENMLIKFIRASVKKTGIRDIVCGGGVFMNVKANMLIANIPEVSSIHIMPSGGDESLSIGAALLFYNNNNKIPYSCAISNLYLGGEAPDCYKEEELVSNLDLDLVDVIKPDDVDIEIASLLANNKIVARCRGRMEWGARSLGNRSILCSSDNFLMVDKINSMIKVRDFWMPFAPSILEESYKKYYNDDKNIRPQYMTMAFKCKAETYKNLVSASHPRDHTIRPQLVTKEANPEYYKLIKKYQELTGSGVILNTSFNLHGEPIVYSLSDAIRVFLRSGLPYLALNKHILSKKHAFDY